MSGTGKMIAIAKSFGASESKIKQEVDSWLDENITNPDSPPLDRSLSSSSAAAPADMTGNINGFLKANNFDSTPGGKINVLTVPYSVNDFLHGKIIYSNGTIQDGATSSVSPLVPVSEGTYGLKIAYNQYDLGKINKGNSMKNGYGFFAADGETVVDRPSTLMHNISGDIYVFDVPANAKYVRFCFISSGDQYRETAVSFFNQWILLPNANDNIDDEFFVLSDKKPDGTIDKIMRSDGSRLDIVDPTARQNAAAALAMPITFGRRTFAIFEKVGCIGDSFMSGYIVDKQDVAHTSPKYSWVEHIKNITGREYVNMGIGGATTASWLTAQDGLAKAQLPENKAQAYIIGLQINDVAHELPVGTSADIGTTAQTYYGCTSKIVDEMFAINTLAHIFLLRRPIHYTGPHTAYQNAISDIVEWYQTNGTHQSQVHLIDLDEYYDLFALAGCNDAYYGGHFTPVGHESVAEIMLYALSNYMDAHPLTFQDANLIPYGKQDDPIDGKADKVSSPTAGNFAALDSNGNLTDSGRKHSDYAPNAFVLANDFDVSENSKVNLIATPYSMSQFLQGKLIYADGTIKDSSNSCTSPLIPISAGTYGLKTSHNSSGLGQIKSGNSYKNGYGFFAADGTTVVARPTTLLHNISGDIFVFDVPSDAKYVRFSFGANSQPYYETACGFFNSWILLPNANDQITDAFFDLGIKKGNGTTDKIKRTDGSYLELRDDRFGIRTRMKYGAHNGAEYYAPECTIPAYRIAGQQRWEYAWISSIQFSADGSMYVLHDGTVDRTTDGTGNISDLTDAQIDALHIDQTGEGYNLADFDPTELHIPTFEQVLQQCAKYGMKMVVAVHAFPKEYTSAAAIATWDAFADLIKAYNVHTEDLICYLDAAASATICRNLFGNDVKIAVFLGQSFTAQDYIDWFTNNSVTGNRAAIINVTQLSLSAVKLLHSNGIDVFAYGSHAETDASNCALWGVDVYQNSKLHMLTE